jgi:hypothetical protein
LRKVIDSPLPVTISEKSPMKNSELIRQCRACYEQFNASTMTLDTHIDTFLENQKIDDEFEAVFVKQVVYGLNRYKKMLKVALSALYFNESGRLLREDNNTYLIFAYLMFIRMDDLGYGTPTILNALFVLLTFFQ